MHTEAEFVGINERSEAPHFEKKRFASLRFIDGSIINIPIEDSRTTDTIIKKYPKKWKITAEALEDK